MYLLYLKIINSKYYAIFNYESFWVFELKFSHNSLIQSCVGCRIKTISEALNIASLLRILRMDLAESLEIKSEVGEQKTDRNLHFF